MLVSFKTNLKKHKDYKKFFYLKTEWMLDFESALLILILAFEASHLSLGLGFTNSNLFCFIIEE
jgi:hypothetical protein